MSERTPEPTGIQAELPLPFSEFTGDLPLLPVRMVNEYEDCPRPTTQEGQVAQARAWQSFGRNHD